MWRCILFKNMTFFWQWEIFLGYRTMHSKRAIGKHYFLQTACGLFFCHHSMYLGWSNKRCPEFAGLKLLRYQLPPWSSDWGCCCSLSVQHLCSYQQHSTCGGRLSDRFPLCLSNRKSLGTPGDISGLHTCKCGFEWNRHTWTFIHLFMLRPLSYI